MYLAYRIAKDPRFQRLACTHKGTYADDCIVERVTQVKALPSSTLCVCSELEYWEYSVES
jgi:rRNA-processing protein FCF1